MAGGLRPQPLLCSHDRRDRRRLQPPANDGLADRGRSRSDGTRVATTDVWAGQDVRFANNFGNRSNQFGKGLDSPQGRYRPLLLESLAQAPGGQNLPLG
jgi:hypothetical protein